MKSTALMSGKYLHGKRVAIATVVGLVVSALSIIAAPASFAANTIDLARSSSFAVLAGGGFANYETTTIQGNLGIYPVISYFDSGSLTLDGSYHFGDAAAKVALTDAKAAYRVTDSLTATATIAAELGGQTKIAGVYQSANGFTLNGTLTLDGQNNPNSVFVFKTPATLTTAISSRVTLINGAQPCNIFWQVGQNVVLGGASEMKGSVLTAGGFRSDRGTSLAGRVFAHQGSVSLTGTSISRPSCLKYIGPIVDSSSATQVLASGSGEYVAADGKARFTLNLRTKVASETATPVASGTLSWSVDRLWSFTGKLTTFTYANSVGRTTGSGTLYYWGKNNSSKNDKKSGWIRATTNGANVEVLFLTPALTNPASNASTRVTSFAIGFTGTKISQVPTLPVIGALNTVSNWKR